MANTYRLSSGERITQATLDKRISEAKKELRLRISQRPEGRACDSLDGKVGTDCSHILSVGWCKKNGLTELCYDLNNMVWQSREAHNIWEHGSDEDKQQLNNYAEMMAYASEYKYNDIDELLDIW